MFRFNRQFSGLGQAARIYGILKLLMTGRADEKDEYLRDCLEECRDLRSHSLELQGRIKDRTSEYHLSPARANLIRWLDLAGCKRVLELGAGCGSITRYLGEQNLVVHAVESCPVKASLTRKRCRDLANVLVHPTVPKGSPLSPERYDIIFCLDAPGNPDSGVTGKEEPWTSSTTLLHSVLQLLGDTGVLVVAVDNDTEERLRWADGPEGGRQEALMPGAPGNESSFPRLGRELEIVTDTGTWAGVCYYPFPDHHFPRVLLADQFIATDEYAYSLLYRVLAREQPLSWQAGENEFLHWKMLCEAGRLGEFAPSALMLIARDREALRRIAPYDFVHFSSEARRLEYRTVTFKPRGKDRVEKRRLYPAVQDEKIVGDTVRINAIASRYEQGPLVTTLWLKALLANDAETSFTELLRRYYSFVREQSGLVADNAALVDLLPSNLVAVAGSGPYKVIDQEWIFTEPFPVEYILFRALLWFGYHNRSSLATCCGQEWETVGDFVEFWFQRLGLPLEPLRQDFILLEDDFHAQVVVKGYPFTTLGLLAVKMNT